MSNYRVRIDGSPVPFADGEAERFQHDLEQYCSDGQPHGGIYRMQHVAHEMEFIHFGTMGRACFVPIDHQEDTIHQPRP